MSIVHNAVGCEPLHPGNGPGMLNDPDRSASVEKRELAPASPEAASQKGFRDAVLRHSQINR